MDGLCFVETWLHHIACLGELQMKQETIVRTKLTAAEGMILTNGKVYGRVIFLSVNDSAENWHEITEAEYEERTERMENEDA